MNKISFILSGIALTLSSLANAQQKFTITGTITKIPSAGYAYLSTDYTAANIYDSAQVVSNTFHFTGKVKGTVPDPAYLLLGYDDPKKGGKYVKHAVANFYIEKGDIKVKINGPSFGDSVSFTGTYNNEALTNFVHLRSKTYLKFSKDADSLRRSGRPDSSIQKQTIQKVRDFYADFLRKNPNAYISLELLSSEISRMESPKRVREILKTLSPSLQRTEAAKGLDAVMANADVLQVGMMAPDFTEKDTAGVAVKLSSYRGKYVLLDFWASWCHPCREESPFLISAYQHYKDRNFSILGVSLDNSKIAWLKAIKEDKLPWQQLSALNPQSSESVHSYGVMAVPSNFLIDPSGKIVAMNMRQKDLEETLAKLIGN